MRNSRIIQGLALVVAVAGSPVFAQRRPAEPQPASTVQARNTQTISGTVVSASRTTLLVRTEDGRHALFVFDDNAARPDGVSEGRRVRVISRPGPDDTRVATDVVLLTGGAEAEGESAPPVPSEVRRIESQIERQARRWRAGVRVGAGLDPEIITAGVHAKVGPFFHRDVWFRPNVEFGIGEVTTLAALNFEAVYRLPINERSSRWTAYVGAGPGLNFINRDFEEAAAGERDIDFSDFDFEGSLNILAGVENRNGLFLELKTAAFSRPTVRMLVGYSF